MLAGLMSGGIATPRSAPVMRRNHVRRRIYRSAGIVGCYESDVMTQKGQDTGLYGVRTRGKSMSCCDFLNFACM